MSMFSAFFSLEDSRGSRDLRDKCCVTSPRHIDQRTCRGAIFVVFEPLVKMLISSSLHRPNYCLPSLHFVKSQLRIEDGIQHHGIKAENISTSFHSQAGTRWTRSNDLVLKHESVYHWSIKPSGLIYQAKKT